MLNLKRFYNKYHKKNKEYFKVISDNNFTYFYLTKLLSTKEVNNCQTFLDIGCGVGTLSLYLAEKGKTVLGIDVSSRAVRIANRAKKHLGLKNVAFKTVSLEEFAVFEKFDAVLLVEVLEHIKNDQLMLNKINNLLRRNGLLILTTPSKSSIMYKLGFYNNFDQRVGHLRRYTKSEVEQMLNKSGYKIVYLTEKESLLRSLLFTTGFGFLIKFIKGPFVRFLHFIDEALGKFLGYTDILVIAQKV